MGVIVKKTLQRNQRCTCSDLIAGDRFTMASDKKKIVYQVLRRDWKHLLYIDAAIADRGQSADQLIKWASQTKYSRETIYIRNINDQAQ